MNTQTDLKILHEQLIEKIKSETNTKMSENIAHMQAESVKAQANCACDMDSLKFSGANISELQKLEQQEAEANDKEFLEQDQFMAQTSTNLNLPDELDIESNFLPSDAHILTPSWSDTFSDTIEDNPLVDSNDLSAQAVVGGGNCKNIWNWAKGAGGGCIGGTASNTQVATWVFWFKPSVSRFYAIKPKFVFNGNYISKASDRWYNCKRSNVKISAQTNVYQYNWKGLSSVNLVNINSQNINRNRRLDDTRYTNYSALLGKDDWAAIVCSVKVYVRAQGSGSYSKTDFSTGANKVCVPHVIIN